MNSALRSAASEAFRCSEMQLLFEESLLIEVKKSDFSQVDQEPIKQRRSAAFQAVQKPCCVKLVCTVH